MKKIVKVKIENKEIVKEIKIRQSFAPKESFIQSKKVYNRKKMKLIKY